MIGLLGGTFDPIHYGHLRPAQETMAALGLRELRLIPAGIPPHRAPPVAGGTDRLAMARLAAREFPGFVVDDREVRRGGPSYTVLTLESLRAELGDRPLCLLLGLDAFRGIETWHAWRRLPELAHLIVMQRPGYALDGLPEWARERRVSDPVTLAGRPAGGLVIQPVSPQDISGSGIRARLKRGEPVDGMLPKAVIDYIYGKGIYGHGDRGA
ncbi:MAG TPA: nicotinate-nucleotide adenylyltransferase [Acidiferrobacterales bacterium]